MAVYNHVKKFIDFLGLNLKADDLTRDRNYATLSENAILGDNGQLEKRPGSQTKQGTDDGGMFTHTKIVEETGVTYEQLVAFVGDNDNSQPHITDDVNTAFNTGLNIYYTLGNVAELAFLRLGPSDFRLRIWINDSLTLDTNVYSLSLASIVTAINGVSGFVASVLSFSGTGSRLDYVPRQRVQGNSDPLIVKTWELANNASAINIPNTTTIRYQLDIEDRLSHTNIKGVSYFNDKNNSIWKYDGDYFSRAGLPTPITTITPSIVGSTFSVYMAFQTRQTDYAGNEILGPIVYEGLQQTDDGWNLHISLQEIAGNVKHLVTSSSATFISSTATKITQKNNYIAGTYGTTDQFKVGDKIADQTGTISRYSTDYAVITAISGTEITYEYDIGSQFNPLVNGAYITHRLYVDMYWTINGGNAGGPYYFHSSLVPGVDPYNPSVSAPVNYRNHFGSYPGDILLQRGTTLDQRFNWSEGLPKGNIVSKFQNSLIISGKQDIPGTVNFSDQTGPEQFDLGINSFLVDGNITGIGATKEHLAIFTKKTVDVVTGDLPTNQFRVDRVSSDFGCLSHFSIAQLDEDKLIYLTQRGPYQLLNGLPSPLGKHTSPSGEVSSPLEPYFAKLYQQNFGGKDSVYRPDLSTALAVLWPKRQLYILNIKEEAESLSTNYKTFVFDYDRNIWISEWVTLNMQNRATIFLDDLWFQHSDGVIQRFNKTATSYDYSDNGSVLTFRYGFAWEHFGEPSIFKKFLRYKLYPMYLPANDQTQFNLDVYTYKDFDDTTSYLQLDDVTITAKQPVKFKIGLMKALALRFLFINETLNENVSISAIDLEVAAPFKDIKE